MRCLLWAGLVGALMVVAPNGVRGMQVVCAQGVTPCPPEPDPIVRGVIMDGASGMPVVGAVVQLRGAGAKVVTSTDGAYRFVGAKWTDHLVVQHRCYYSVRVERVTFFGPINIGLPRRPSHGCGEGWPVAGPAPERDADWSISGRIFEGNEDIPLLDGLGSTVSVQGNHGGVIDAEGRFHFTLPNRFRSVTVEVHGICHLRTEVLDVWPAADGVMLEVRVPWNTDSPWTDTPFCGAGPGG